MRYVVASILTGLSLLFGTIAANAQDYGRLDAATQVFQQIPGKIPAHILNHAKGIAVVPGEVKGGFIFGGELGGGVLVSRLRNGTWSAPAFISVGGASFGFQIGGETRNIVLVFNTRRSLDVVEHGGSLNLGGDVSVVAGPVGAQGGVATGIPDVFAYVSSFGAFAGATVQGTVLSFDYDANRRMYGISDPLGMRVSKIPGPARRFSCTVARYTGASTRACG